MKVIIPAGGKGTRLLPLTKVQAKEMLPLGDRPLLQYMLEECATAKFDEAIIVRSPEKISVEQYFSKDKKLEEFIGTKKMVFLKDLYKLLDKMSIKFAVQKKPQGDGDAILQAKKHFSWRDKNPFAVNFGDTLFDAKIPVLKSLTDLQKKTGGIVIGVKKVDKKETDKYGIVAVEKEKRGRAQYLRVTDFVEKPAVKDAPSDLAVVGMYILENSIWKAFKKCGRSKDGELRLADALIYLLKKGTPIYACEIKEDWLDTGSHAGYIKANTRILKRNKDYRKIVKENI